MSAVAVLTVQAVAPVITTQPAPRTVALGQSASFNVAVAGATTASLATPPAAGSGTPVGSFGADADFTGGGIAAQPNATISVAGVPDAAPRRRLHRRA